MNDFDYRAPDSLAEVTAALDELGDDAKLIAGGTALAILMKQRLVQPAVLVSLRRLDALRTIGLENGSLRIGAMASHRQVENHPQVQEHLPALVETLRRVATPRIRNQGTLGGNLVHADPNQDPPPTLIALDASVRLASSRGTRELPVADLFTDYYETALEPGEVLTDVLVPIPAQARGAAYLKFMPRTADDYATVAVAAALRLDNGVMRDVRIGLGALGSTPLRAREAEAILEGQPPAEETIRAAAAAVQSQVDPLSDLRGTADYKREMAGVFTRRAVQRALERA
jgi:aerobic carbon-monoxide dehydrogenase medium subunit